MNINGGGVVVATRLMPDGAALNSGIMVNFMLPPLRRMRSAFCLLRARRFGARNSARGSPN